MNCAITGEPIETPFGKLTHVGPKNHLLIRVEIPHSKGKFPVSSSPLKSVEILCCAVCKKRLNQLRYGWGVTQVGPRNHILEAVQYRMNPFVVTRGDKVVMRPFAKLLFTLVIIIIIAILKLIK